MDQAIRDVNKRLDKIITFIEQNMLTKQDFEEFRSEAPTRADFAKLLSSVDGIARSFITTEQELRITSARTLQMEDWIRRAASKLGITYNP